MSTLELIKCLSDIGRTHKIAPSSREGKALKEAMLTVSAYEQVSLDKELVIERSSDELMSVLEDIRSDIQKEFREENLNMYEGGFNDGLRVSLQKIANHAPAGTETQEAV